MTAFKCTRNAAARARTCRTVARPGRDAGRALATCHPSRRRAFRSSRGSLPGTMPLQAPTLRVTRGSTADKCMFMVGRLCRSAVTGSLQFEHPRVPTAPCHETVVVTVLLDPPVREHDDAIGH